MREERRLRKMSLERREGGREKRERETCPWIGERGREEEKRERHEVYS